MRARSMLVLLVVTPLPQLLPSLACAEPLTLAAALARAVERAPESVAARAQVPIVRADVRSAGMWPNPTVGINVGQSEPIVSLTTQWRLPILGQRSAHVRAAERAVEQSALEAEATVWRLRHDARVAYYAAARSDEEVAIALEVEQLTGRVSGMARERFEVGAGARLEKEQAELVHVRALQDIVDKRAVAVVSRLDLGRLLGLPPGEVGELTDALSDAGVAPALAALEAGATTRHPELRALGAERSAALARAVAARSDVRPLPTLELTGELLDPATCSAAGTSRCLGPRAGLSFDVPIFNWNGGPVERARAEARAAELKTEALAARVLTEVRSAHAALVAALVRARFFDEQYLPSARAVEQMAREGFTAGKTGLLPLLEAERAILEARVGRSAALFAVQQARADLEEASGVVIDGR